jgi:hypothetical protein
VESGDILRSYFASHSGSKKFAYERVKPMNVASEAVSPEEAEAFGGGDEAARFVDVDFCDDGREVGLD